MTSDLTSERREQELHWQGRARSLVTRIEAFNRAELDVSYYPPADDDWRNWRGAVYLAALHKRYSWACMREGMLADGKGPFYCRECEERPAADWRPMLCLDCSWENYLREEAIAMGRQLARRGAA